MHVWRGKVRIFALVDGKLFAGVNSQALALVQDRVRLTTNSYTHVQVDGHGLFLRRPGEQSRWRDENLKEVLRATLVTRGDTILGLSLPR